MSVCGAAVGRVLNVCGAAVGRVLNVCGAAVGRVLNVCCAAVGRVLNAVAPNKMNCSFTQNIYVEENISNVHYEEK